MNGSQNGKLEVARLKRVFDTEVNFCLRAIYFHLNNVEKSDEQRISTFIGYLIMYPMCPMISMNEIIYSSLYTL